MFIKDYRNNRVINVDMVCRFQILPTSCPRGKCDIELSLADSDTINFRGFNSKEEAEEFINVIIYFKEERGLSSVSFDFIMSTVNERMGGEG